jgi:hypothetical protein
MNRHSIVSEAIEMDELRCICGTAIVDEGTPVPWKGYLISDSSYDELVAFALGEYRAFFAAESPEARDTWMSKHFGLQWRRDLSDAEHLQAFLHALLMDRSRIVYECVACGRLLVDECSDSMIRLIDFRPADGPTGLLAKRLFSVRDIP